MIQAIHPSPLFPNDYRNLCKSYTDVVSLDEIYVTQQ